MRTLTREKILEILKKELPYLRKKYGVGKMVIFGSYAKGLQKKRSDVDILVELKEPLGLDFVELAYYLEDVLGKKVDIATFNCFKNSLKNPRYRHIAKDVEKSLIYV